MFIGRFQPLHKGHLHAIHWMQKRYRPVIGVGSSEKMNTWDNPLSFGERRKILRNCLTDTRIVPIPDREEDMAWRDQILQQLDIDKVVTRNDWTASCFDGTTIEIVEQPLKRRDRYEGTQIREAAADGEETWKELVPACAREPLDAMNFEERVNKARERSN